MINFGQGWCGRQYWVYRLGVLFHWLFLKRKYGLGAMKGWESMCMYFCSYARWSLHLMSHHSSIRYSGLKVIFMSCVSIALHCLYDKRTTCQIEDSFLKTFLRAAVSICGITGLHPHSETDKNKINFISCLSFSGHCPQG